MTSRGAISKRKQRSRARVRAGGQLAATVATPRGLRIEVAVKLLGDATVDGDRMLRSMGEGIVAGLLAGRK